MDGSLLRAFKQEGKHYMKCLRAVLTPEPRPQRLIDR